MTFKVTLILWENNMITAKQIVEKLELEPHSEGGYFKEVYRSADEIKIEGLPERYESTRCFGTSIYYLLEGEQFSAFHKLKSDETWHFYHGSPIIIHQIDEAGNYSKVTLSDNVEQNEQFQFTVPRGTWFAAEVKDKNSYSFVGCAVYPGFDFKDFEMGEKEKLVEIFPNLKDIIDKFTL